MKTIQRYYNASSGRIGDTSRYEKIEESLKLMKKSGRETFTVENIEDATGVRQIEISRILIFTSGVANMGKPTKRPRVRVWYFTGESIYVPKRGRKNNYD